MEISHTLEKSLPLKFPQKFPPPKNSLLPDPKWRIYIEYIGNTMMQCDLYVCPLLLLTLNTNASLRFFGKLVNNVFRAGGHAPLEKNSISTSFERNYGVFCLVHIQMKYKCQLWDIL